jgi:hypothetical protein
MGEVEKVKKEPNPYIREIVWKVLDIVVSLIPLLVLVAIQFDVYFSKESKYAFSNIIGLAILSIFIGFVIAKKTKIFGLLGISGIITLVLWLLRSIIADLVLISSMATLGLLISKVWTTPLKMKWERKRDKKETADTNANAMEKVVEKIITRSGRV